MFKGFLIVLACLGMSLGFVLVFWHNPTTTPVSAAAEGAKVDLPIVMYHKVSKSNNSKYVISVDRLEADFIAFKKHGFNTVFMSEVVDWVDGRGTLPEKPLVITFDDGQYNNLFYTLPIAKKHGIKFMINPVTSFSQFTIDNNDANNPSYSHLTWEQMREATESGHVEIGNHTHKMHAFKPRYGIAQMGGESDEEYKQALANDIKESQMKIESSTHIRPTTFAYPFGKYSPEAREVLIDLGFRALLTCNERVDTITQGDPTTLHSLGRFNRSGNYSTETIMEKLTKS